MPDLRSAIAAVRRDGKNRDVRCPAHDDHRASLSIGIGEDGKILLHCKAGCRTDAVLEAVGLAWADLFEPPTGPTASREILETYKYLDERSVHLFDVVRFAPKDFRQRRADGIWNLKGIRRIVYHLDQLQGHRVVHIVEGEKDADRLRAFGFAATTSPCGAGRWRDEYTQQLKAAGCQLVVVLPDADAPGESHARDVARSCSVAGLSVKIIPLPGLAKKGADVSDWLDAGHTRDELLALADGAPLFDPSTLVAKSVALELTSIADLLNEPDDQVEWLIEDRMPAGAVILIVGAPKSGKSTFVRRAGFAISRGEPFLGWRTSPGPVWFFVLEDKRSEVKKDFRRLGATGMEPIRLFVGQAPADLLDRLQALAQQEPPAAIVIDTLARGLKVRDFNDYAEVTTRFEPLLKLSRGSGATLLLSHHASAHSTREGLDAVLGSTALSGSVDNVLILKRTAEGQRVLSSIQRIGPDLEPSLITLNAETGRLERAGTKREADDRELGDRLLAALRDEPDVPERWIQSHVEGRNTDKVRVLRRLVGMGLVLRLGAGGQRDPYRYRPAGSCSREAAGPSPTGNTSGTEVHPGNSGLNFESAASVPDVPIRILGTSEQELQTPVRGDVREYVRGDVRGDVREIPSPHDLRTSVPAVPDVPDPFEKRQADLQRDAVTPDNHNANSCSHEADEVPPDGGF
jgi:hypothetical protein